MSNGENTMFIAVVCRVDEAGNMVPNSSSSLGAWSSYLGKDRDSVIARALRQCTESNQRDSKAFAGSYRVFAGTLTDEAKPLSAFSLVPLA
jgi:hypothetical protein